MKWVTKWVIKYVSLYPVSISVVPFSSIGFLRYCFTVNPNTSKCPVIQYPIDGIQQMTGAVLESIQQHPTIILLHPTTTVRSIILNWNTSTIKVRGRTL